MMKEEIEIEELYKGKRNRQKRGVENKQRVDKHTLIEMERNIY